MRFKNSEVAAAWLAGMIDGEGHVRHGLKKDGTRTVSRYKAVQITNTDTELLDACFEACSILGIECKLHEKPIYRYEDGYKRKPCYVVWILGRENLEKIYQYVPIQAPSKKNALEIAITSYVDKKELGKRISEGKRLANERKRAQGLPLRVNK